MCFFCMHGTSNNLIPGKQQPILSFVDRLPNWYRVSPTGQVSAEASRKCTCTPWSHLQ